MVATDNRQESTESVIKKGKQFIYKERWPEWENFVREDLGNNNLPIAISAIETMELLDLGVPFATINKLKYDNNRINNSFECPIICRFSRQGPQFIEGLHLEPYIRGLDLARIKHENEMFSAEEDRQTLPQLERDIRIAGLIERYETRNCDKEIARINKNIQVEQDRIQQIEREKKKIGETGNRERAIAHGKRFIYEKRWPEWENYVRHSGRGFGDIWYESAVVSILEVMEMLDLGASFDEVDTLLWNNLHSDDFFEDSSEYVLGKYCKQGPQFLKHILQQDIDWNRDIAYLSRIEAENIELAKGDIDNRALSQQEKSRRLSELRKKYIAERGTSNLKSIQDEIGRRKKDLNDDKRSQERKDEITRRIKFLEGREALLSKYMRNPEFDQEESER